MKFASNGESLLAVSEMPVLLCIDDEMAANAFDSSDYTDTQLIGSHPVFGMAICSGLYWFAKERPNRRSLIPQIPRFLPSPQDESQTMLPSNSRWSIAMSKFHNSKYLNIQDFQLNLLVNLIYLDGGSNAPYLNIGNKFSIYVQIF